MPNDLAHFTLSGTPLCNCQYPANQERLVAASARSDVLHLGD